MICEKFQGGTVPAGSKLKYLNVLSPELNKCTKKSRIFFLWTVITLGLQNFISTSKSSRL